MGSVSKWTLPGLVKILSYTHLALGEEEDTMVSRDFRDVKTEVDPTCTCPITTDLQVY